ncbi:unnamed protein product [Calypogeia fissa]
MVKEQYFQRVLEALGPLSEEDKRDQMGTFAGCEAIKPSQGYVMRSFHVDGAGELKLPLSAEDTSKLRTVCEQAPFGRGSATLADPNLERCWQVDASKVTFPDAPTFLSDTVQQLAMRALRQIETGTRLCLAFNLIRRNSPTERIPRGFVNRRVKKAEDVLQPWLNRPTSGKFDFIGVKLAFPLQHRYTEANLSFAGLKGDDLVLAEVLKNCRDQSNQKVLDVHLCLVARYRRASVNPHERHARRFEPKYDHANDPEPYTMAAIMEENIWVKKWVNVNDERVTGSWIENLEIDFQNELVVKHHYGHGVFDYDPDLSQYTSGMGNHGCEVEYWSHVAMLVVWPKAKTISVFCELGVSQALDDLESRLQTTDPSFCGELEQIAGFCKRHPLQVWEQWKDLKKDTVTPRLLQLCTRTGMTAEVLEILDLLAADLPRYGKVQFKIGVRNVHVVQALATSVEELGWRFMSLRLLDLVKTLAFTHRESIVELAKQLITMGMEDAGQLVANTIFQVYGAHIAQLESYMPPEPVFTWCQPRARLPEYPDIETFLRGPTETFILAGFSRIAEARAFCETYCNNTTKAGYSVIGTIGGRGHDSFCEITKTRNFFEADQEKWHYKQEEVKHYTAELEKLRAAVPTVSTGTVTESTHGSGQQDAEKRRLDEVTTETEMAETSLEVFMDRTENTLAGQSCSKRAKASATN